MEKTICYCKDVSESKIKSAISQGIKTLKDIQQTISACIGNNCEELNSKEICCTEDINEILQNDKKSSGGCSCCV